MSLAAVQLGLLRPASMQSIPGDDYRRINAESVYFGSISCQPACVRLDVRFCGPNSHCSFCPMTDPRADFLGSTSVQIAMATEHGITHRGGDSSMKEQVTNTSLESGQ